MKERICVGTEGPQAGLFLQDPSSPAGQHGFQMLLWPCQALLRLHGNLKHVQLGLVPILCSGSDLYCGLTALRA